MKTRVIQESATLCIWLIPHVAMISIVTACHGISSQRPDESLNLGVKDTNDQPLTPVVVPVPAEEPSTESHHGSRQHAASEVSPLPEHSTDDSTPVEPKLVDVTSLSNTQQELVARNYAQTFAESDATLFLEAGTFADIHSLGSRFLFREMNGSAICIDRNGQRSTTGGRYTIGVHPQKVPPIVMAAAKRASSLGLVGQRVSLFLDKKVEILMHRSLYEHLKTKGSTHLVPGMRYVGHLRTQPLGFSWTQAPRSTK